MGACAMRDSDVVGAANEATIRDDSTTLRVRGASVDGAKRRGARSRATIGDGE
jgi:hypothetical protein